MTHKQKPSGKKSYRKVLFFFLELNVPIFFSEFYPLYSSETDNFFLPFARRAAKTRRPLAVAILERKPCLFFLFLFDGWNVLFIL